MKREKRKRERERRKREREKKEEGEIRVKKGKAKKSVNKSSPPSGMCSLLTPVFLLNIMIYLHGHLNRC